MDIKKGVILLSLLAHQQQVSAQTSSALVKIGTVCGAEETVDAKTTFIDFRHVCNTVNKHCCGKITKWAATQPNVLVAGTDYKFICNYEWMVDYYDGTNRWYFSCLGTGATKLLAVSAALASFISVASLS